MAFERVINADGKRLVSDSGDQLTFRGETFECWCCEAPGDEGAICYPDGTCVEGSQAEADDTGGTYQGNGTTCAGTDCDGAICPDGGGVCYQGTLAEATAAGDHYFGYGVACVDVDCDCDSCGHYIGKEMSVNITKVSKYWLRDPNPLLNVNDCSGEPCGTITETWNGTIPLTSSAGICQFSGFVDYVSTGMDCDGVEGDPDGPAARIVDIVGTGNARAFSFQASCPDPEHLIFIINGPSLRIGGEDYPGFGGPYGADGIIFETLQPITCNCGEYVGSVTTSCDLITVTRPEVCQPGYCPDFETPDALGSSSVSITGTFTVVS